MKMQMNVISSNRYPIAMVTDSIADIPQEFIDENLIHVLPINVFLEDTNYLDRLSIGTKEILNYIDNHEVLPTSAQPNYREIEKVLKFLSSYYKKIILVTVASKLSGTYNIACNVVKNFSDPNVNIKVIDSKLNSSAQGMIVMKGIQYIKKDYSIDQIAELLQSRISKTKIYVNVKSIDNMIKSGRLSHQLGSIAKTFHLKPIVSLDEDGKGTLQGIAVRFDKSKKKTIKKIEQLNKKNTIDEYSIVHCQNIEEAQQMAKDIKKILKTPPLFAPAVSHAKLSLCLI